MGINAFVAFGVVGGMKYTPAEALATVLLAGILFLLISLTPIRAWIINSIPRSLKLGIGAGIGLFLSIIGLEIMGVVGDHPVTLVTLGDIKNPLVLLGCLALVVMIVLENESKRKYYHWYFSFQRSCLATNVGLDWSYNRGRKIISKI